jgi:hypothetical protein
LPSKGAEWAALEERCRWAPHAREDCRVGQVCQHRRDGVGGLVVRGGALLAVEDAPSLEAEHEACGKSAEKAVLLTAYAAGDASVLSNKSVSVPYQ